jgi:hypothetical protein
MEGQKKVSESETIGNEALEENERQQMREREINLNNGAHGKELHCVKTQENIGLMWVLQGFVPVLLVSPATRESAVIQVASGWVLGRGRTVKVKFNRLDLVFQWRTG